MVQSDFEFKNVRINDSTSDMIDFDFCKGMLTDSTFSNAGGDALDFSGSQVELSALKISKIQDKAISGGENSTIKATQIEIENVGIGVASKDGSDIVIDDSKLSHVSQYAFESYIKKKEYSACHLKVSNTTTEHVANLLRREAPCTLDIDHLPPGDETTTPMGIF